MRLGGGKAYAERFGGFAERPAVGDCGVDPCFGRGQVEQRCYCLALRQRHAVGRRHENGGIGAGRKTGPQLSVAQGKHMGDSRRAV